MLYSPDLTLFDYYLFCTPKNASKFAKNVSVKLLWIAALVLVLNYWFSSSLKTSADSNKSSINREPFYKSILNFIILLGTEIIFVSCCKINKLNFDSKNLGVLTHYLVHSSNRSSFRFFYLKKNFFDTPWPKNPPNNYFKQHFTR